jgi:hypothetical protein
MTTITRFFRKAALWVPLLSFAAPARSPSRDGIVNVSSSPQSHRAASSDQTGGNGAPGPFTRLDQLRAPQILASADAAPSGCYHVRNRLNETARRFSSQ